MSFDIFSEIFSHLYFHERDNFNHIENSEMIDIVTRFIDLTHDYANIQEQQPIWDLCGRLYFPESSNDLTTELSEWLNMYYPLASVDERREEEEDEELEEHNGIGPTWVWELARQHLLRGNLDDAIEALEFLRQFVTAHEREAANELIDSIHEFSELRSSLDNQGTYIEKWTAWSEQCKEKYYRYKFSIPLPEDAQDEKDDEIVLIYSILAGDEDLLLRCGNFFEQLVGILLFIRPLSSLSDLNQLAEKLQANVDKDIILNTCTAIIRGCFDDAFQYQRNNIWLQTHLGYSLVALGIYGKDTKGLNNRRNGQTVMDPIYYGIQEYASMIADKYNMWNEAVIYLTSCLDNKEIWIKQLLGNPPLPSKDINQLLSILDIAREYKLFEIQRFIHKALGQRYEQDKNIQQATIEYGKAQDLSSLDRLSDVLFTGYLNDGKLKDIVTDMEELKQSPRYAALIRYRQFRDHLENKEWKDAAQVLKELLTNKNLPPQFESVLLVDNLDVLQDSKHYYDASRLFNMIQVFKQVIQVPSNQTFIADYYRSVKHIDLSPTIITAKIREQLAYKAATAPVII
ncbi:MAG: nucleoporin Nup85-like protein [Benjaminiella poitrasii]|nr:MAG: nucleoporin Nup85-like protein [Benjaminiella poitrasii]